MIVLTEKAIKKIKEIVDAEGITNMIRVKIIGGGCASFTNDIHFEEQVSELDEVFEQEEIKVVIDPFSHSYLDGTIIEYLEEEFGGGFKFSSPNAKSSCGCGKSSSY
jgi:iron-sulfur cluster insertion protein